MRNIKSLVIIGMLAVWSCNSQAFATTKTQKTQSIPTILVSQVLVGRDYFYNRAMENFDKKNYRAAFDNLTKDIEINPNRDSAYSWRAKAREALRDFKGAIDDYTKAIRIGLYNNKDLELIAERYYNRGVMKGNIGYDKAALLDFNLSIQYDPEVGMYYYGRGLAMQRIGYWSRAKIDFRKAAELGYAQ